MEGSKYTSQRVGALKLHPLGKEHITKGATMKTNGFPSTFNDWMPNPGSKQDRLFLQIVIEAINPPKQDFSFLLFFKKKFF